MRTAYPREKPTLPADATFRKELERARSVQEGWRRCQELAHVARFAPEGDVLRVAKEALKTAGQGRDAYQQVAVCAWPIRALIERDKVTQALAALSEIFPEAGQIPHPICRMDALFLLWQAVMPLPLETKRSVLTPLLTAIHSGNSWKAGRVMVDLILMFAGEDRPYAERLAAEMREGKYKRQAQRRLAAGETLSPRSFF